MSGIPLIPGELTREKGPPAMESNIQLYAKQTLTLNHGDLEGTAHDRDHLPDNLDVFAIPKLQGPTELLCVWMDN